MKSSRSGYSHRGYPNQKVDPITARILSANQKRRAIAGNQAGEIKKKNMQLYGKISPNQVVVLTDQSESDSCVEDSVVLPLKLRILNSIVLKQLDYYRRKNRIKKLNCSEWEKKYQIFANLMLLKVILKALQNQNLRNL